MSHGMPQVRRDLWMVDAPERFVAATHESAHAVLSEILGFRVKEVRIYRAPPPDQDKWIGECALADDVDGDRSGFELLRRRYLAAIHVCAGYSSESIYFKRNGEMLGADLDALVRISAVCTVVELDFIYRLLPSLSRYTNISDVLKHFRFLARNYCGKLLYDNWIQDKIYSLACVIDKEEVINGDIVRSFVDVVPERLIFN